MNEKRRNDNSKDEVPTEVRSPWLTVKEAAGYLKLSIHTLRKYIRQNSIPFKRLPGGRRIILNRRMLDLWIIYDGRTSGISRRERKELSRYGI